MPIPYGKYLLDRKLTEGGMAEIFIARPNPSLASQKILARPSPVVIKRLFSHHSSEADFVRMFQNESALAGQLKHPNIVDIFDQGETEGTFFLAMEYIRGEDLRSIAQQADNTGRRPGMNLVIRVIMDTLAGLHYAHTLYDAEGLPMGLVHRDVSPQNVLVTYEGVVKLIDFGIAKATRSREMDQTQAGTIKGKYAYMSPEQTRSGNLDARSDVFSVGTLLWELLTWRRLFKRATDLATLVAVTEETAPPAASINPEVPKELDDILMKSLSMDREQRWESAKAFHDALGDFVDRNSWDTSTPALSAYMKDVFAEKIVRERRDREREAALAASTAGIVSGAADDRMSSGLPVRGGIGPSRPGDDLNPRQRAMTMPLAIINPSQIQQRKAMVVPRKDGRDQSQVGIPAVQIPTGADQSRANQRAVSTGPGTVPTRPTGAAQARSSISPRSSQAVPGPVAGTANASVPMRIVPDSRAAYHAPDGTQDALPQIESASASASQSAAAYSPSPSALPGSRSGTLPVPLSRSGALPVPTSRSGALPVPASRSGALPIPGLPPPQSGRVPSSGSMPVPGVPIVSALDSSAVIESALAIQGSSSTVLGGATGVDRRPIRARYILAIVLGVLIGIIAVLCLKLLIPAG